MKDTPAFFVGEIVPRKSAPHVLAVLVPRQGCNIAVVRMFLQNAHEEKDAFDPLFSVDDIKNSLVLFSLPFVKKDCGNGIPAK